MPRRLQSPRLKHETHHDSTRHPRNSRRRRTRLRLLQIRRLLDWHLPPHQQSSHQHDLRRHSRRVAGEQLPLNNKHPNFMKMHLIIRRFAGFFILLSLVLAHYHSPYWLWFTAFVGFNLLQSSFTDFCPLEIVLKKLGVGGACCEGDKSRGSCCAK